MNSVGEAWFSGSLTVLFGLVLILRLRFPNASRTSETIVLVPVAILFFVICGLFLGSNKPLTHDSQQVIKGTSGLIRQ
jgi:hypothetical protein